MEELLENFEPEIGSITLIPSDGGRFEVSVNERLVYSKLELHRHAEPGEIVGQVSKLLKESL